MEGIAKVNDFGICVPARWLFEPFLTPGGEVLPPLMTKVQYDNFKRYQKLQVAQRACYNKPALVVFNSLGYDLQSALSMRLGGHPADLIKQSTFSDKIKPDMKAATYFATYRLDNDKRLPFEAQKQYTLNACILNAIHELVNANRAIRKSLGNAGNPGLWPHIIEQVEGLDTAKYPHSLPVSDRLRITYRDYVERGYQTLVSGKWANRNSQKVDDRLERLICSIHGDETIPFYERTAEIYMQFLAGMVDIADTGTGELFDPADFTDKNGAPLTISKTTVWNILTNPRNAPLLKYKRINSIDYRTREVSYSHRQRPDYSLAKISMDDRTLSRKTTDGKWVNAYLAVDLGSEAIIGYVFSPNSPDTGMVMDCFRSMYHTIDQNRLKWPAECEVENHIMSGLRPMLEAMFPFVTFCNPGNSKQKGAEHIIRKLKYCTEKKNHKGIGRHYGKGAYKTKSEHKDDDYKQERLPYEQIVADAIADIMEHNHGPHPRIQGKTRWEVLTGNQYYELSLPDKANICRWIGNKTETSFRNNDYCRVQHEDYYIEEFEMLYRLKPNQHNVEAYWLPAADGEIKEVYVYQGENFIGKALKYQRYQEAKILRTPEDEAIMLEQQKRQSHQRRLVKEGLNKLSKLELIKNKADYSKVEAKIIEQPQQELIETYDNNQSHTDYMEQLAFDSI